jgi:hypothetical protein
MSFSSHQVESRYISIGDDVFALGLWPYQWSMLGCHASLRYLASVDRAWCPLSGLALGGLLFRHQSRARPPQLLYCRASRPEQLYKTFKSYVSTAKKLRPDVPKEEYSYQHQWPIYLDKNVRHLGNPRYLLCLGTIKVLLPSPLRRVSDYHPPLHPRACRLTQPKSQSIRPPCLLSASHFHINKRSQLVYQHHLFNTLRGDQQEDHNWHLT